MDTHSPAPVNLREHPRGTAHKFAINVICFFAAFVAVPALAAACPFDDGNSTLANEGLVLTRYALGMRGAPMVANTAFAAADAPTIESNIACPDCGLNITGESTVTAADATIISRKLAGFSGASLTNGLALGVGTRNTPAAVQSFLLAGCGVGSLPTCLNGQVVAFGESGALQCGNTPPTLLPLGVASANVTGLSPSMALPADGRPVIVFMDSGGRLSVIKCNTATCTGNNVATVVDPVAVGAGYLDGTSVAVPSDGLPIVSYFDAVGKNLKVLKCGNAACTSGNTSTTIDAPGYVGTYSSIAVPSDGLPVISYFDETNNQLKVAKCANSFCTATSSVTPVDSGGAYFTSVAVPAGGTPIISYLSVAPIRLKVVKCGTASCASGNTVTVVDPGPTAIGFSHTSIKIPSDGLPVLSYSFQVNGIGGQTLSVAKCGNAACSSGNTVTVVDAAPGNYVGRFSSLAVHPDGRPMISYYDESAGDVRVMRCGNASCSSGNVSSILDGAGNVGWYTSIAVPSDGRPLVFYAENGSSLSFRIAKCSNAGCLAP